MRRKNVNAHKLMANVIEQTGHKLVSALQDISNSTKALETQKIDMQVDMFSRSMDYKHIRNEENGEMV